MISHEMSNLFYLKKKRVKVSSATVMISTLKVNLFVGILVILDAYEVTCACGILTEWSFFAMGSGTIQLFVLRPNPANTIIGSSSFYVPPILASGEFKQRHLGSVEHIWSEFTFSVLLGLHFYCGPPLHI